ncbi:MAG TPA: hypothetical protein ENK64_01850 [Flavobacteriales bacterium]|jgi:hypothetical protein|nr:hypothetical protein [Flavobacteriales bacterium]
MKPINKITLKVFLIAGGVYGVGIGLFDYLRYQLFDFWKFLFSFISFGLPMSLLARYNYKHQGEE